MLSNIIIISWYIIEHLSKYSLVFTYSAGHIIICVYCVRNNFRYKQVCALTRSRDVNSCKILHHNPVYFEPISMQTRTFVRHVQHSYILNLILFRFERNANTRCVCILESNIISANTFVNAI